MKIKISDLKQVIREELGRQNLFENPMQEPGTAECVSCGYVFSDDMEHDPMIPNDFFEKDACPRCGTSTSQVEPEFDGLDHSEVGEWANDFDQFHENKRFDRASLLREIDGTDAPCNIGEDPSDLAACTAGQGGNPCSTCLSFERGIDVNDLSDESSLGIGRRNPTTTSQFEPRRGRDRRISGNTPSGRRGIR